MFSNKINSFRKLHIESLENRELLSADIIFQVQSVLSHAKEGGVFNEPNEQKIAEEWGSSLNVSTEANFNNIHTSLTANASTSNGTGTFTAHLDAVAANSTNMSLYIESNSSLWVSVWIRGTGYIPYSIDVTQNGTTEAYCGGDTTYAGAGLGSHASATFGGSALGSDGDYYQKGRLGVSVGTVGLKGEFNGPQSNAGSKSWDKDGSVNGSGIATPYTREFDGEIYQLVWFSRVSCSTDGMVWSSPDGWMSASATADFELSVKIRDVPEPKLEEINIKPEGVAVPTTGKPLTFEVVLPGQFEDTVGNSTDGYTTKMVNLTDVYDLTCLTLSFGNYYGNQKVTLKNYTTRKNSTTGQKDIVYTYTITPLFGKEGAGKSVKAELTYENKVTKEVGTSTKSKTFNLSAGTPPVEEKTGPTNYAILFAGTPNPGEQNRYQDAVNDLKSVLVQQYKLSADHIHVLTGYNANLLNLNTLLSAIGAKMDENDHLLFYTFGHGVGIPSESTVKGDEGWVVGNGSYIFGGQMASALSQIKKGYVTTVFSQCYSGGILEPVKNAFIGSSVHFYGMAAANHYEQALGSSNPHSSDYFATAFIAALRVDKNNTASAFSYVFTFDKYACKKENYPANGGDSNLHFVLGEHVEHPWATWNNKQSFPIFASVTPSNKNGNSSVSSSGSGEVITFSALLENAGTDAYELLTTDNVYLTYGNF